MIDSLGRDFTVGDIIVYPVRYGSHMNVEHAIVISLDASKNRLILDKLDTYGNPFRTPPSGLKRTYLERFDRATIISLYDVQPLDLYLPLIHKQIALRS